VTLSVAATGGAVAYAVPTANDYSGYRQPELQADLDAIHAAGVTGVIGEVDLTEYQLVGHSGVADVISKQPVDAAGYFRIGGNTMTFVAVVVLQLVAEGRISLDDSVERWLPGVVSGNGNDGSQITVRQLLQHTSGIYNYTNSLTDAIGSAQGYEQRRLDHYTPADLVAIAMAHPPAFPAGTGWAYSSTNYIVLGMIIKKATGQDWFQQAQARILAPLHMIHTLYLGDRLYLPDPHADGYQQFTDGGPLIDTTVLNSTLADAAGSLVSTAADLTRFWQALQRGALLPAPQMAQMHDTVATSTPGTRYGLGITELTSICGAMYWSHDGEALGYNTVIGVSADGHRSAVLSLSAGLAQPGGRLKAMDLVNHAMCVLR
jgi:D-alanyl-D-alanine carboxypeptidase